MYINRRHLGSTQNKSRICYSPLECKASDAKRVVKNTNCQENVMKQSTRKLSTAIIAGMIGSAMMLSAGPLEAKQKGGSAQEATCAYLYSVITYPYVSPTIQAYAMSLYVSYGCTAAL